MDHTQLKNKKGYFFDGETLLKGYIGGEGSAYFNYLSGKVIYSKPFLGSYSRPWRNGYKYDKWDWSYFEFIPNNVFNGLNNYLSFIETATYEQIKKYFELKEIMKTEDFLNHKIKL